ncbi:MAG: response regulator transcription factor [Eubacteriales bacterium]|jgi:DNA-binding response OmpR family regulator
MSNEINNRKPLVLVVDDDKEIVRAISINLEREGYRVLSAFDGEKALQLASENGVNLIILDIMMPKLDGLSALMKIRERNNIPVILLSAKSEDTDKILGLSIGADDYVTKPYNPDELIARVRAQLRRYMRLGDINSSRSDEMIRLGDLELYVMKRQAYAYGEPVHLTATEYKIFELLLRNAGRVYPAEEIYERIWSEPAYNVENTVMVHIRRIREKIEINPSDPKYLKVVWGIGYKIEKHNHTSK